MIKQYETEEYVTYAHTKDSVLEETFYELMSKVGPYEDYILWGFNPWSVSGWNFCGFFTNKSKAIKVAKECLRQEINRIIAVKVFNGKNMIFSERIEKATRRERYRKSDCKRLKAAKANEAPERFR